jgi:hypothetical protein
MAMKFGPSESHIPAIRKFGLKSRKARLKVAQPKLSKIMKLDNKQGE